VGKHGLRLLFGKQPLGQGQLQQVPGLDGRTIGYSEVIAEPSMFAERVAFRDVQLDRQGRSLKLIKKRGSVGSPPKPAGPEDPTHDVVRYLPGDQTLVISHRPP